MMNAINYSVFIYLLLSGFALADEDADLQAQLHDINCESWDMITQVIYEGHAIHVELEDPDPIGSLKEELEYEDYHAQSAGRAMFDAGFADLTAGVPLANARARVVTMCKGFPAEAVDPSWEYEPISEAVN